MEMTLTGSGLLFCEPSCEGGRCIDARWPLMVEKAVRLVIVVMGNKQVAEIMVV